jgi:hypothetical protein
MSVLSPTKRYGGDAAMAMSGRQWCIAVLMDVVVPCVMAERSVSYRWEISGLF